MATKMKQGAARRVRAVAVASTCALALNSGAVAFANESAGPAKNADLCSIAYTKEEIPALAARELDHAMGDYSWGETLRIYNAKKKELETNLAAGQASFELRDSNSLPPSDPAKTWDTSSVIGEIFGETSSLTPERTGRMPYGAIAFMYNAYSWRQQVAQRGCPAPGERPAAPEETWQVKVPEGSAAAPFQIIGALIGLGVVAAIGAAVMPHLPQIQRQIEEFVLQFA